MAFLFVALLSLAILLPSSTISGASNWWWIQRAYGPSGAYYSNVGATSNDRYVRACVAGTGSNYRTVYRVGGSAFAPNYSVSGQILAWNTYGYIQ